MEVEKLSLEATKERSEMGMRRLGWFLLLLFLFPSSSNPSQNPLQSPSRNSVVSVSKGGQNVRKRGVVENGLNKIGFGDERIVRPEVHVGGHGVGGHGGGGHSEGGHGGGGAMNHHNNNKDDPRVRGAKSCTTNYIGFLHLTFLVLPLLFLI
ncbi:hypothetical protein CK203_043547 [Vitis vinifera]|uniref:Uncharacterized protein n=1 Tax=Vitis vinifera TaxID=29760 RepID=A0A438HRB8_VITVI|nr:hypothetical protein CK203_043547 [Vitis vinifera]